MISLDSIVVAVREQVHSDLAGEILILDLKHGIYYGLDAVGARIWALIQQPKPVNLIRDAILAEFDVELERCEQDLLALLQELETVGLVEVKDATRA